MSGFCTSVGTFPINTEVGAALEAVDGDSDGNADGEVKGSVRSSFLCKWFVVSCWVLRMEMWF